MASIRREIRIAAPPEVVWDAVSDVGAVHRRLGRGFLTDAVLDGDARVVTFANGMVLRELIVDIDPLARRFAYTARGGRTTHHNASMQVLDAGDGTSILVWIADLLPHDAAAAVAALMDQGCAAISRTLEDAARG